MRRGGMRGWLALGAALTLLLMTVACREQTTPPDLAGPSDTSASPSASAAASPTPQPPDPAATAEVCGLAAAATETTTTIFNEQIAALEQAAARNDQAAMVVAAEAINEQFMSLGNTFTQLAKRRISPELRVVLTDISTALEEMSALSYTGTTVDIRRKLLDFGTAIGSTCATPSPSPSPAG
jgi:hypothetical protein